MEKEKAATVASCCEQSKGTGNFCKICGTKIVTVCECWRLNRRFNCGFDQCPSMVTLMDKFGAALFPPQ